MKAMTWQGGNRFTHNDVPDPVAEPGFVVVKMDTTGICGTDVHATQGLFPWYPPQILGHEGSGVIVEVGEGVAKDRIGQRVAVNRKAQCYECWSCRNWNTFRCEVARESSDGMYAEYIGLDARAAIALPEDLNIETAVLTEPASCCLSAVELLDIPYRATGLVIGAGVMGLFTAAFMKSHGVKTLVVSEPVTVRRGDGDAVRGGRAARPPRRPAVRGRRRRHRRRSRLRCHRRSGWQAGTRRRLRQRH